MSINCCLTTTTVYTYFESNIAEMVTVTDRNWMFHHLKINIRLPPKCRQTLPCCAVTRSPTSRHLQLSGTPGTFPRRLQLHPSSRSSLPCDVPRRHSKGAVTHLQHLLPLLGIPFLYLPPCQRNPVKMLLALILSFLVSSAIATEKGGYWIYEVIPISLSTMLWKVFTSFYLSLGHELW